MKLDKNQQRQLIEAIRMSVEKNGYKIKSNSIFTISENAKLKIKAAELCHF